MKQDNKLEQRADQFINSNKELSNLSRLKRSGLNVFELRDNAWVPVKQWVGNFTNYTNPPIKLYNKENGAFVCFGVGFYK